MSVAHTITLQKFYTFNVVWNGVLRKQINLQRYILNLYILALTNNEPMYYLTQNVGFAIIKWLLFFVLLQRNVFLVTKVYFPTRTKPGSV
jgi:hypothetical protein